MAEITDLIDPEYQRYRLSLHLYSLISRGLNDNQRYEIHNILERWLLRLYNEASSFTIIPESSSISDSKLIQETLEKKILSVSDITARLNEIKIIMANTSFDLNTGRTIERVDNHVKYGMYYEFMNSRIQYLVNWRGQDATLRMLLRYASLLPRGQQWGIPQAVADVLYSIDYRTEGFASPLNSRFLEKEGGRYCSLFYDTDATFGSLGSFFTVDIDSTPGNWEINPPLVESLFDDILDRTLEILQKGRQVFFVMAAWTDTQLFQTLSNHPQLHYRWFLKRNQYYYETPDGEPVIGRFRSVYFILGGSRLNREDIRRLNAAWRP